MMIGDRLALLVGGQIRYQMDQIFLDTGVVSLPPFAFAFAFISSPLLFVPLRFSLDAWNE